MISLCLTYLVLIGWLWMQPAGAACCTVMVPSSGESYTQCPCDTTVIESQDVPMQERSFYIIYRANMDRFILALQHAEISLVNEALTQHPSHRFIRDRLQEISFIRMRIVQVNQRFRKHLGIPDGKDDSPYLLWQDGVWVDMPEETQQPDCPVISGQPGGFITFDNGCLEQWMDRRSR